MRAIDRKNLMGGALLLVIGGYFALDSFARLQLGTLSDMGPGLFPAAVGTIVALLGAVIMLPAFFRAGSTPTFELRPMVAVLSAVAAFAVTIDAFGAVFAVLITTAIVVFAESRPQWRTTLGIAVAMIVLVYVIFIAGLGVRTPLIEWPPGF